MTEILTMLEDFSLRSSGRESSGGFLAMARDGYEIVLSPERDAVTHYSTVHRERTWSQFKAGVPSRFRAQKRKAPRLGSHTGPEVADSVVVEPPEVVLGLLDVERIFFTKSAFVRGGKMAEDVGADHNVEAFLRRTLREDIAGAPAVEHSETGAYLIHTAARTWIVRPDLLSMLGVRPAGGPPPTERIAPG